MEKRSALKIIVTLYVLVCAEASFSQCIGLVKGPAVFDVKTCKDVSPKEDFNTKADYSFFKDMTASDKARFTASYKGILVHGLVVNSTAVQKGFDKKQGALAGSLVKAFIAAPNSCAAFEGKRLNIVIDEMCCGGSADVPCLLDTPYVFKEATVVGPAGSAAGDKERSDAMQLPAYQKAVEYYKERKYAEAAKSFESVRAENRLDVQGHFLLGVSYRKLDDCPKAIPVLQTVFDRAAKKDVWADQEAIVRKSNFLLARCHARLGKADKATIILNSYLIEPKRYKEEIRESLKNPDFGWINSTKQYIKYREAAIKRTRESR